MSFLPDSIRSFCGSIFRPVRAAWIMIAAGLFLVFYSAFVIVSTAQAEPPAGTVAQPQLQGAAEGKKIFEEKCTGCHSIGGGKLVGPDLKDVTKRRDHQWITSFILDPAKMIASDPTAQQLQKENNNLTMPTLGLTSVQVEELVEYLSNPGSVPGAVSPAAAAGAGDPVAGKRIFLGEAPLANGGPACIACHTVSGAGGLGGGALGPDLTHVIQRLSELGLTASLKTIAFPTMAGPFQNRPLTAQEQANLVAFLKNADLWQPPVPVVTPGALTTNSLIIFLIGLGGALVFFGLMSFFWSRLSKRRFPRLSIRKI